VRRFTVTAPEGDTITIDAESVKLRDDGIVQFMVGTEPVGLSRSWATIESEPLEPVVSPGPTMDEVMAAVKRTRPQQLAQQVADQTGMGTIVTPSAPPDRIMMLDTDNIVVVEPDGTQITGEALVERMAEDGAVAEPQTSEPDAPGVSTDPIPEPEPARVDDVDANPPDDPGEESTEADDPSASPGDSEEADRLKLTLGRIWASQRRKPILNEYVDYAQAQGIPETLTQMTVEHMRQAIAWFEKKKGVS
jgi:hypothetical protein